MSNEPKFIYGIREGMTTRRIASQPDREMYNDIVDALNQAAARIKELEQELAEYRPEEPLPCPFCGLTNIGIDDADERDTTCVYHLKHRCRANVRITIYGDSRDEVIKIWNSRQHD